METEYFIWHDDDFNYNEGEHVEVLNSMFNVINKSGYDIIAGSSGKEQTEADWPKEFSSSGRLFVQQGKNGMCVDHMHGAYGKLPGFPNCFVRLDDRG